MKPFIPSLAACFVAVSLGACSASAQPEATWLNEPATWQADGDMVSMTAEPETDFWRKTYFGYVTDNGHLYGQEVTGDFTATVKVTADYAAQYDQAGLMVREDETTWMKCGLEYVDGALTVSSVFTRDFSDWAGAPAEGLGDTVWLRLVRKGGSLTYAYSADGESWREVRQGYLTDTPTVLVGLMAAAPEGPGFEVQFEGLDIVQ
jgi:uncharacterized protein